MYAELREDFDQNVAWARTYGIGELLWYISALTCQYSTFQAVANPQSCLLSCRSFGQEL